MTETTTDAYAAPIAAAMRTTFQVAYVTRDIRGARRAATNTFGALQFDSREASFDLLALDGTKLDDMRLSLSFAFERRLEIIEPLDDPGDLFGAHGDRSRAPMVLHHTAAIVSDLRLVLDECRERHLTATRVRTPPDSSGRTRVDVAYIDLRDSLGHMLELIQVLDDASNVMPNSGVLGE